MKTLPFIIFGIAALAQWAAPLSQIWTHEQTLAKGTLIKLKCAAPDPYDPLRGRFLAVRPEQQSVDVPRDAVLEYGSTVYGVFTTGSDGLATITRLDLAPPTGGDFIRFKTTTNFVSSAPNASVGIQWPFERFYINEQLALEADEWFAKNIRSAKGIVAEVRVLNGRAVLADLSLDDKQFREILKERVK